MNTHSFAAFRRLAALAVLGILLTVGASHSQAQVTIYAKFLDGTIGGSPWAGESTDPGRTGWAKLESFSFGFTNASIVGGATAPVAFNPGAISKAVDRLTPQIFTNLASGTPLRNTALPADLTIEFVKDAGAGPVVFFRVEMKLVYFSSQGTATNSGDDTVQENVQIQFGAVRVTNTPILPGGTLGTPVIRSWSHVLNNSTFNVP
jgi:type VI protein secretion system component Hcp